MQDRPRLYESYGSRSASSYSSYGSLARGSKYSLTPRDWCCGSPGIARCSIRLASSPPHSYTPSLTLAWVDRGGSGTVPLFSSLLVGVMIVASMLLFSRLVQAERPSDYERASSHRRQRSRGHWRDVSPFGCEPCRGPGNPSPDRCSIGSSNTDAEILGCAARRWQTGHRGACPPGTAGRWYHRDEMCGRRHFGLRHAATTGARRQNSAFGSGVDAGDPA